jgi:hypothetical protein
MRNIFRTNLISASLRIPTICSSEYLLHFIFASLLYDSREAQNAADNGVDILEIKFENLLSSLNAEFKRVSDFTGLPMCDSEGNNNCKIPDEEKKIHGLVMSGKLHKERLEAWQNELSRWDKLVIESLLFKEMRKRGYSPVYDLSLLARFAIIGVSLPVTAVLITKHYFMEIVFRLKGGNK